LCFLFWNEEEMKLQHFLYILFIILLNGSLITLGVTSPVGLLNMFVVGITHFRDTLFVIIRILFKPCVRVQTDEEDGDSSLRNVLCVIPTYKEEAKDVTATLDSLIAQEETKLVHRRIIMVCDGFLRFGEIFSNMVLIESFQYKTYKQKLNQVSIFFCTYNGFDLILILKHENAGKKDSLILIDSIFVDSTLKEIRTVLLKFFNITEFNFIFHTDADSIISPNTLRRHSNIMKTNPKISGVTGIVMVPEKYRFWSLFQGFQYYYGQLIRRLTESMWGKPSCMPGCTNMVNVTHDCIIEASARYQKLPSRTHIFQVKNRLQGTDRRYTNCVLQHSKNVKLVTDGEAHCFTVPPQSFRHFRSQRKRWTSNAITGYFFLLIGQNIPWYVRFLASIDLFRIHTCVTRLVSTALLMSHITDLAMIQIILMVIVFGVPYFYFLYFAIKLGKYGLFLFTGSIVSKFVSPFITVYNFLYCVFYFTDISWGISHGAVKGEPVISVTEDYPVKDDDPETLV